MHNDTFRIVRLRHLICFMKYQPSDNISLSIFDTIESRRLAREINKFLQFTILSACWWKISTVEKCEGQISTKKTLKFSAKPKSTENQTKPNQTLCVFLRWPLIPFYKLKILVGIFPISLITIWPTFYHTNESQHINRERTQCSVRFLALFGSVSI